MTENSTESCHSGTLLNTVKIVHLVSRSYFYADFRAGLVISTKLTSAALVNYSSLDLPTVTFHGKGRVF